MILQEKEKIIKPLFDFFDQNERAEVKIIFKEIIVEKAVMDTMYENDDESDEYNIILMRNMADNSLFEISYHNIPEKVIFQDKIVFGKELITKDE